MQENLRIFITFEEFAWVTFGENTIFGKLCGAKHVLLEPLVRQFGLTLLSFVINVGESETCGIAISPFEIVHDRPSIVTSNSNSILVNCKRHVANILTVVIAPVDINNH